MANKNHFKVPLLLSLLNLYVPNTQVNDNEWEILIFHYLVHISLLTHLHTSCINKVHPKSITLHPKRIYFFDGNQDQMEGCHMLDNSSNQYTMECFLETHLKDHHKWEENLNLKSAQDERGNLLLNSLFLYDLEFLNQILVIEGSNQWALA